MVSERFKLEVQRYRARGGRLYKLAMLHGMPPSMLSASLNGTRPTDQDERLVKIGAELGLTPAECFESEPERRAAEAL